MSFQAMAWAIKQEAGSISGKAILLMLANYADDKGQCFPGQDKLAQECECSIRTIRDWLDRLEKIGLITRIERRRNDGYRTSDLIVLNLENSPAEFSPENGADLTGNSRRPHRQNLPSNLLVEPSEDTLSETSSDETRKGKKRISYPDQFEALWKTYPTHQNMSKKEAFDAWRKLDEVDKTAALEAVTGYKAFLAKKPDTEVIHLCRFITKRRFDGYASQQGSSATSQTSTDADWLQRLNYARKERLWSVERWGAMPKMDGCCVPPHLLEPADGDGWKIFEKR